MHMQKWGALPVALGLTFTLCGSAAAQVKADLALTRSLLRTDRQEVVARAMNLREKEGEVFWPLYREYQAEVTKLNDRFIPILDTVFENKPLGEPKAQQLIDEVLQIREDELKLKKTYVQKFRTVLPAPIVVRYFQLEDKLDAVDRFDLAGTIPLVK
ncbi:hypothetical protein [Gloeobacter violaceus]|uniref:Glr2080 protein n=1 Tax=Gloeobacter violaceus (strain ATCC 29082 / PCC 7421) TaxID=251221 RepID=Q7NIV2_GLOVI|nr:hypothetical protein [Gloeobacter violaceus]BAC90021.1 glr2080 [Gloeobacter violaceus PCC 7421]